MVVLEYFGSLWVVVDRFGFVLGSLWVVVDGCGSFWVVLGRFGWFLVLVSTTSCTHNSLAGHSFHATTTTNKSTVTFRRDEVCDAQLNAFYAYNLHVGWVLRDKEVIFMNLQPFDPSSLKHNTFRCILH